MQVAIIGCGLVGNLHAQAVRELGYTIAMVVDPSEQKAKEFAELWGAEHFGASFPMALEDDIQCIHICTPPTLHYAMARDALNAGKHVICEKPLCLNPDEAKELVEIAQEKQLINAVNFNVRYHDVCKQARNFISSPDFGKICLVHGSYLQEFHALPDQYSWRYKPELAGHMRATTEIGSHWIDLARFWTALEITEVSANYGKFTPERYIENGIMYPESRKTAKKVTVKTDDAAVISIRFSNKAIGNLLLSEVSHGRDNQLSIEVTGTKSSVWWNTEDPYHFCTSQKSSGIQIHTNAFGGGFPTTFKALFKEVYQDIESNRPSRKPTYPTFYDGYVNSMICTAIYESANNNSAWVKVRC
ncbi:MAG TPA: Gfo/Idh/MocA family oxidoreductase [Longilinea sp.]|nr:Gfo/Idh/MocA family oxidoreductase [Longilinea sp.]